MAYKLIPPTVDEAPGMGVAGPLFGRVAYPRGISLLVIGGQVYQKRWPTIEEQWVAEATYLGGHEYILDDEAAQILIDAGYSDYLEPLDEVVPG